MTQGGLREMGGILAGEIDLLELFEAEQQIISNLFQEEFKEVYL